MQKKYKNLSRNVGLFFISSFGHKILAFFFVPLYTNFLTTRQYGTVDLISTTVNLLLPIFTLNIAEAVMRFTIDDKDNDSYLGIGIKVLVRGFCLLSCIMMVLWICPILSAYKPYYIWILAIYTINSLYNLEQSYLRAINRISTMVRGSLLNSIIMFLADIALIAIFKLGIEGYYMAMLLGLGIAAIYMDMKESIHQHIKWTIVNQAKIQAACLSYCIPTVFTTIGWWINSSLDRYFVIKICGLEQNGIYSMAYKIPSILAMLQSIFNQAWVLTAITEFDPADSDNFFSKTYELYVSAMLLAASLLVFSNLVLARILYMKDFFEAWRCVPMLLMATLFSALAGYLGGIFAAVKDMRVCAYTVILSAVTNILLNIWLIPIYGIQGAAIATAIAYMVSWTGRVVFAKRHIRINISFIKNIAGFALFLLQIFLSLSTHHAYHGQAILLILLVILYFNHYKKIINIAIRRL